MKYLKNILLVDDDEVFIYLTEKMILQSNLARLISKFYNGLDALNFIKENVATPEHLPEMILLDLSMPIMDGWQFLHEYGKISPEISRGITIYICTSSISDDDIRRAKQISAISDYLIKPVTKEKFIEIVSNLEAN
jgi:CheY-like chemotaxis protein